MPNAASKPPTNVGTFSSDRSNIGLGVRYSITPKSPSRTPPAINDPATCADPQPTSVLRISPNTSATKAALKLTKPAISSGAACASCDSGTRRAVISSATAPTGMLTKKIQRQERPLVIRPPSTGPDRYRGSCHGTEDTERDRTILAAKRVREQRQRRGEHDRPANPLHCSCHHEEDRARREPAQRRRDGKQHEAGAEAPSSPIPIGE